MRHRTISWFETRDTHQEGWKEMDDEGSLGGQQFHTYEGGKRLST